MAEDQVKRITGLNPMFHTMSNTSSIDAAVPVQDDSNDNFYPPVSSNPTPPNDQRVNNGLTEIASAENAEQNSSAAAGGGGNETGRRASLHRVASLEHLQKRIRGDGNPCEVQTNGDK